MISYIDSIIKKIISMLNIVGKAKAKPKTLSMVEHIENNFGIDSNVILDTINKLSKQSMRRRSQSMHSKETVETTLYGFVTIEMLCYNVKKDTGLIQNVTQFTISDSKGRFFDYR